MSERAQIALLLRKDVRGVWRDRFLLFLAFYAAVIAGAMRLLVPWVPLEDAGLYAAPFGPLLASMLVGQVLGFVLIEERETRTWLLLRVLPLRERTLYGYLTVAGLLLAGLVSLLCAGVYGRPVAHPGRFAAMMLANAALAPAIMLALGAAASNKIEGLALGKIAGSASLAPAILLLAPMPWQLLLAWNPWYWLYLGLLRAWADDPELAARIAYWPGWPGWTYPVVSLLLAVSAAFWAAHAYRRGAAD